MPLLKLLITSHSWLSTAERKTADRRHCLVTLKQFQITDTFVDLFFVILLTLHASAPLELSKPSLSKWGQVHNLSFENEFYLHENENHLHIKGWVLHWSDGVSECSSLHHATVFLWFLTYENKMKRILSSIWLAAFRIGAAGKSSPFDLIIYPLLITLVRSRWWHIGLALFWVLIDLDFVSVLPCVLEAFQARFPVSVKS